MHRETKLLRVICVWGHNSWVHHTVKISFTHKLYRKAKRERCLTYGGLSHFLCLNWTPVPQVLLHMLHWLHGLQSPSTCWGMGVLLTHSPDLHHWCTHTHTHTDYASTLYKSGLMCAAAAELVLGGWVGWKCPALSAPHSVPSSGGSSLVLQDESPSIRHQRPAHIRCWNTQILFSQMKR